MSGASDWWVEQAVVFVAFFCPRRRQDEIIKPMLFECVASGEIELIGAFEWEQEDDVNVEVRQTFG